MTQSENHPFRTINVWAVLGAIFLCIQIYVYSAWILSPGFHPTDPGGDPIPEYSRIAMIAFQAISVIIGAVVLVWFIRGVRDSGRIDAIRLMMLGWVSAYWLDPFLNFLTPMFTYNAYLVNFGSWSEFIPGWQSSQGARVAEPLLVDIPNYFYNFTFTAFVGYRAMQQVKVRWPSSGRITLALAALIGVWMAMTILDVVATRFMYFDAWPGSVQSMSLWGGQFYQFPGYELLIFPLVFVACAFLLNSRDSHGYTAIERGLDPLQRNRGWATSLRVLAFVGFCNVLNLAYTSTSGILALSADPWPRNMPSWLANEQCGERTGLSCQTKLSDHK